MKKLFALFFILTALTTALFPVSAMTPVVTTPSQKVLVGKGSQIGHNYSKDSNLTYSYSGNAKIAASLYSLKQSRTDLVKVSSVKTGKVAYKDVGKTASQIIRHQIYRDFFSNDQTAATAPAVLGASTVR